MKASPDAWITVIAPDRKDLVVPVECIFTWDLARRPLGPGPEALGPRARAIYTSAPRRQGHTRHDRRPHDCRAAPRRHAPPGLF
jgi:hypothetical protein